MPTYEYRCKDCRHELEAQQAFSDDPLTVCPSCGGLLKKKFSSPGISFKGSGFYKTDSRTSSSKAKANGDSASTSESTSSSDSSGSSSSESAKPASSDKGSSDKGSSGTAGSSGSSSKASTAAPA
jgi:putative FmdB family regulatory protein